jgi:outer membrane protein OmpA-like peptidoglycan-associated protein
VKVRRGKLATALWLLMPLFAVSAEPPVGTRASFIACPIYRDTDAGRKSGCWVGDDPATGTRFDLSLGIAKPQLAREVLVEGIVAAGANACGGVVLEPVRTSVLETLCSGAILPAEGFPGRRYVLPNEVASPTWVPRKLPQPPYSEQHYVLLFNFGSDFLNYQYSEILLEKMSLYAKASQARSIHITGFAATQPLRVSGRALAEPASLARTRAEIVAEALRRLDIGSAALNVDWRAAPAALDQPLGEASKRRVDITIVPGANQTSPH